MIAPSNLASRAPQAIGRWRLIVAAAVVLTSACVRTAPAVAPEGPIPLAVVSWNTNAGAGDLPRLLDDLASGRVTGAPPRDYIVLLQEAVEGRERDPRTIAAARRLSVFYSPVRRGPERTSGNAVLSTLPLENPVAIDLPRERQPRGAVAATVRFAGDAFFVVGAHLENRLPWLRGLFGDHARGRQAQALLRAMPPRGHGVLGGDMNTMLGPTEPAWRAFLRRFPDTPARLQPTFRNRLVLDHLFFDLPPGWVASRRVLADSYGSDHHPVLGLVTARAPEHDPVDATPVRGGMPPRD